MGNYIFGCRCCSLTIHCMFLLIDAVFANDIQLSFTNKKIRYNMVFRHWCNDQKWSILLLHTSVSVLPLIVLSFLKKHQKLLDDRKSSLCISVLLYQIKQKGKKAGKHNEAFPSKTKKAQTTIITAFLSFFLKYKYIFRP